MKFLKSTFITFFTNVLLLLTAVATTIITSRVLGSTGKGVLAVSSNILSFSVVILGLGFAASNVYFIGADHKNTRKVTLLNIIIAAIAAIILVPLYFLNLRFHFGIFKGLNNVVLVVVMITVPFMILKTAIINIILGLQEIVAYNKLNIIDKFLTLAMMIVAISLNKSPLSVLVSNFAAIVIVTVMALYLINKKSEGSYGFDSKLLKNMVVYGTKAQIGNLVQLLNYRINIFIINYFLTIDMVGIYSNAVAIGETLWQVSGSIATIIFPMTTGSKNKEELKYFINKVTRISFTLIIIFSIILGAVSDKLIYLFFGKDFTQASKALLYLLPGISIFSISNILSNYMAGINKIKYNIYSSLISFVFTLIFNITLIPRFGINGAAVATSLSYIVFTISAISFYKYITKSKVKDIIIIKKDDIKEVAGFIKSKLNRTHTQGE